MIQEGSSPDGTMEAAGALPRHQRLSVQLAVLFSLLLVVLAGITVAASFWLTRDPLAARAVQRDQENASRLALRFSNVAGEMQTLATTLATLAGNGGHQAIPQLVALLPDSALIDSVGVWPAQERSSQLWMRDSRGMLQAREDYNDPRTASYVHEKWYTPVRYMPANQCYWTPAYRDPLSHHTVISCSVAIKAADQFAGVVTVSLDADALRASFLDSAEGENGYSLLLDDDNQILAQSMPAGPGKTPPRNLAELGQQNSALNPLALALNPAADGAGAGSNAQALLSTTRDMSTAEALAALRQIAAASRAKTGEPRRIAIDDDPFIGADAEARVIGLPGTRWHLVSVSGAADTGNASRAFYRALVTGLAATLLTLILLYVGLRRLLVQPLQSLWMQLGRNHESLDIKSRNEIGAIAGWYNRLYEQNRSASSYAHRIKSQLTTEAEERRKAQEALAHVQERASLMMQSVSDGVITTDSLGRVDDMNAVAEQLTGQSLRAAFGKPFNEVFTAQGKNDVVMPNLALMVSQRGSRLDYSEGMRLIDMTRQSHPVQLSVIPIRTQQNRIIGAVAAFRRRSASAPATAPQEETAPATGAEAVLPSRSALHEHMRKLLDASREPRQHGLIIADIDNLKDINDRLGMEAGDEAIDHFANLLKARLGKAGRLFRLSGARYAIIIENHTDQQTMAIAEALRISFAGAPFTWESRRHTATASFGVAEFNNRLINPAEAIQRAENACTAAKQEGRNRVVVWTPQIDEVLKPVDDAIWVRRIRNGLQQNKLHLTTQMIRAADEAASKGSIFEVLLMLEDEEGFWSSAGAFLPSAERNQLMPELDCWVISKSISHLQEHPAQTSGIDFITINLSASSLDSPAVLDHIVKTLQKNPDVAAKQVCFEISEETVTNHMKAAQMFSEAIHGIGCRLSVDRFNGRHVSDVNLLRQLPLDFVKIDSQQYRKIAKDDVEQTIAESLIRLARTLHKRVIVAHLEDQARLEAWKKLGADYFQGHVIAKPSPVIFLSKV